MVTSNESKAKSLGMPHGTANNKLKKSLLFDMAKRLDEDTCYRCGSKIIDIDDFSIEHTVAWQSAPNPVEAFFDVSKIAFSHLDCNSRAGKKLQGFHVGNVPTNKRNPPSGAAWCSHCKDFRPIGMFTKDSYKWNGLQDLCKIHRSAYRSPPKIK